MAKVYLAQDLQSSAPRQLVAVKILREDVAIDDRELCEMFADEARMAVGLVHPNIVRTYESGAFEGRNFMIMEYLEGQSLFTIQQRFAPRGLPLAEELRIIAETAHGLHYAHEKRDANGAPLGIIHRDISPQNVFVTYDGRVKLLDFGIAKATGAIHRTRIGVIKGKIDYMSVEQLQCKPLDRRTDVFALGAMLWEAIAGERFGGGLRVSDETKIRTRLGGEEPKLNLLKPNTPAALVQIVERAIALDREARYGDAEQLARDIERYLASASLAPSARTLESHLVTKFGAERAERHVLIDRRLELLKKDDDQGHSRSMFARRSFEEGSELLRLDRPRADPHLGSPVHDQAGDPGPKPYSLSDAPTEPPTAPPRRMQDGMKRTAVRVGGAIAAFGLAIAVGRFLAPGGPSESATEAVPSVAATAPERQPSDQAAHRAEQAPARTVRLTIDVQPRSATVKLDGVQIAALPYTADVRADERVHNLEASADGHRPQSLLVTFDRDRAVEIVLVKNAP